MRVNPLAIWWIKHNTLIKIKRTIKTYLEIKMEIKMRIAWLQQSIETIGHPTSSKTMRFPKPTQSTMNNIRLKSNFWRNFLQIIFTSKGCFLRPKRSWKIKKSSKKFTLSPPEPCSLKLRITLRDKPRKMPQSLKINTFPQSWDATKVYRLMKTIKVLFMKDFIKKTSKRRWKELKWKRNKKW